MGRTLALIHTSEVFLSVETMMREMFADALPDTKIINIMDDSLLAQCMLAGEISPEVTKRMCAYVVAAETAGADVVLSLCSSLGPTIDVARPMVNIPVLKIDEAHTEKAVRGWERIGVMATVPTTLGPTVQLLNDHAGRLGKSIEVHESLSNSAFEKLMSGKRDEHDEIVRQAARALAGDVDVIVLAQASMARLAPELKKETGLEVLSSPRLAVEYTKQVLESLA